MITWRHPLNQLDYATYYRIERLLWKTSGESPGFCRMSGADSWFYIKAPSLGHGPFVQPRPSLPEIRS